VIATQISTKEEMTTEGFYTHWVYLKQLTSESFYIPTGCSKMLGKISRVSSSEQNKEESSYKLHQCIKMRW
jgi:hypothetical protein